jgi:hypothetical protein
MKNKLNISIPALAVAIFLMTTPMAQGMCPIAPGESPARRKVMASTTVWQKPIVLTQNQDNAAGDKDRTAVGTGDRASEAKSDSAADPKDPSAKSKTAPLKPFKPSEEIAAEQAVDFPVDI